jgi:hypothetical protein
MTPTIEASSSSFNNNNIPKVDIPLTDTTPDTQNDTLITPTTNVNDNDTTNDHRPLTPTIENFNPLPDSVHIREAQRPFIPQHPIFNKEKTIHYPPGSSQWFSYTDLQRKKHEKKVKQKKNSKKQREKDRQESELLGIRMEKEKRELATYHGTSARKYNYRKEFCEDLTAYQQVFHRKMSNFAKKREKLKRPNRLKS